MYVRFPEVLRISLQDSFCTVDVFGCVERFASGPAGISEREEDAPDETWAKRGAASLFLSSLSVSVCLDNGCCQCSGFLGWRRGVPLSRWHGVERRRPGLTCRSQLLFGLCAITCLLFHFRFLFSVKKKMFLLT